MFRLSCRCPGHRCLNDGIPSHHETHEGHEVFGILYSYLRDLRVLLRKLGFWPRYGPADNEADRGRAISFPLTGKDKGRGDRFHRFPGTPIPAFPHQGERRSNNDAAIYRHLHSLRASAAHGPLRGANSSQDPTHRRLGKTEKSYVAGVSYAKVSLPSFSSTSTLPPFCSLPKRMSSARTLLISF